MKRVIRMPAHIGKAEHTATYLGQCNWEATPKRGKPKLVHFISRKEVEKRDYSRLMAKVGPGISPKELRELEGKLLILFEGYDGCEDEIYCIEPIRRYLMELAVAWPFFTFTGNIYTPHLWALVLAVLPNISAVRQNGLVSISYNPEDAEEVFKNALPTAAWMQFRANISKQSGLARLKAIAAHLGLDF